ncbi:MAG: hypothetical protein O2783_05195 [Chloroflexi bacterium]|nr:hypothetical protein [Chloroflexota bacterium]
MFHSWHRCGAKPLSVAAPKVEQEFSERVLSCLHLDDGWQAAVLAAMVNDGPRPDHTLEKRRVEAAIANLKKQHLWGAVTDEEFKSEYQSLSRQIRTMEPQVSAALTPDMDRAAKLLMEMPALWQHPGVTPEQRRELAREVFEEIRLRDGKLVAVKPRPHYAPLFAYSIWHHNVIGGTRSS